MASAIIALFMFIVNYLPISLSRGILPYLTEILRNFNRGKFRNDICQQDWNCNSDDPNILWADWKGKFLSIVNIHAPSRTKRIRSHKAPWINSELQKGMRDRDAAKRKTAKSNDPCDWAKYKKLRNLINNRIKTAKASYYSKAFIQFEGNSRKTWQTINELTSRRKNNVTVKELKVNDVVINNSIELSDTFIDDFSTIGPRLANDIPPIGQNDDLSYTTFLTFNNSSFQFCPISSNIVFSHLNKLSRSKATGLDNISARFIRECADIISVPISDLFNKSLTSGIFPDDWKSARVIPLFKQGERSDLNNYRPISVISVIAKVFERIVYDQLYSFPAKEDVISKQQSGFRSLHSTVTALLEATDSWAFNIDRSR